MTSSHPNPRRRLLNTDTLPLASHRASPAHHVTNNPLKKSSTFHSPTTPPSQDEDPIVNIPLLPRRSPTCPRALEDAVVAGEKRLHDLLGAVDRSLSGLETFSTDSQETMRAEDLPLPRCVLDAQGEDPDCMDVDPTPSLPSSPHVKQHHRRNHHSSDSGIGSSITGSEDSLSKVNAANKRSIETSSIQSTVTEIQSGINGTVGTNMAQEAGLQHALSEYACRHIQKHIISPIVAESSLKDFHPLVRGIPYRVGRKEITCLRDLEKVLLWLAPKWSVSRKSFLHFCETTIQCLHTTVDHLSEPDQRRPTDRPYTNGYFLDLTEQVRQYAAMITASRARMAQGKRTTNEDVAVGERLGLHGGLSQTGRSAELVYFKDGQSVSLRTGEVIDTADDVSDDDAMRSMARRRKSTQAAAKEVQQCRDCDKVFKRPCDLTKHEKTHSRPWKCSEKSCKYHTYGWPTEKERDRHVNDKHSSSPSMFKCQFRPCPYESKRESNCKQHMEKAHGWAYVRSKNNGKRKPATGNIPPSPQVTSPNLDVSSPEFGASSSSYNYGGLYSVPPSVNGSEDSHSHSAMNSPFMNPDERFAPFPNNMSWNDSMDGFPPTGASPYTPSSHRASLDAGQMTHALTMPSSFETSITPHDQDPLFTENFDWSNIDTNNNFTSLNIQQLMTPATSVESRPMDSYSRNPSICLDQVPSLSPGAHGNAMLYSPYSQNAGPVDEGFEDFSGDVGKPTGDFALFDNAHGSSAMTCGGNQPMFQDLSTIAPTVWSGRGTELAQQFGMNNFMEIDED